MYSILHVLRQITADIHLLVQGGLTVDVPLLFKEVGWHHHLFRQISLDNLPECTQLFQEILIFTFFVRSILLFDLVNESLASLIECHQPWRLAPHFDEARSHKCKSMRGRNLAL